jgi:hypothetical protein
MKNMIYGLNSADKNNKVQMMNMVLENISYLLPKQLERDKMVRKLHQAVRTPTICNFKAII